MKSSPSSVFPNTLVSPVIDCPYFTVIISRWRRRHQKKSAFHVIYRAIVSAVDRDSAIFLGLRLYYLDQLTEYSQPRDHPIDPDLLEALDGMSKMDALYASAILSHHRDSAKRMLLQVHATPWKLTHEVF